MVGLDSLAAEIGVNVPQHYAQLRDEPEFGTIADRAPQMSPAHWVGDNDATRRSAQRAARQHSGLVRILKWALPICGALVGAVLLGITFLSSLGDRISLSSIGLSTEGIVMENPKLSGHDGKNRSYVVTAKRAIQSLTNPNLITLEGIEAKIDMGGRDWAAFTARRGLFDRGTELLKLDDGIAIRSGSGYSAELVSADVDLKSGQMSSKDRITIASPTATIAARSIRVGDNGRRVVFDGTVEMTMYPSRMNGEADK